MLIISIFRDYYDSSQGYGVDKTRVFNRASSISLRSPRLEEVLAGLGSISAKGHAVRSIVGRFAALYSNEHLFVGVEWVFFCGKLFPCIKLVNHDREGKAGKLEVNHFYCLESFEKKLEQLGQKTAGAFGRPFRHLKESLQKTSKKKAGVIGWNLRAVDLNELFALSGTEIPPEVFTELGVPYFKLVPTERRITDSEVMRGTLFETPSDGTTRAVKLNPDALNSANERMSHGWSNISGVELCPILKGLQFYKVIDSNAAYGAIEQFVTGVMTCGDNAPDITDDVVKRDSHGFDGQSFKKGKSKMR